MTITLTHTAPTRLIAGDSIEFLVAIPSDLTGWTGSAVLTGPEVMSATSCATEDQDFHVYFQGQGTAPNTASLPRGQYRLTVFATSGNDRKTVAQYNLAVEADLGASSDGEETHAAKMLRVVEAAIEARVAGTPDGGIESYAIGGRSVSKMSIADLQRLRAKYAAEVAQEVAGGMIPAIKFTMTPAGSPVDFRVRYPL